MLLPIQISSLLSHLSLCVWFAVEVWRWWWGKSFKICEIFANKLWGWGEWALCSLWPRLLWNLRLGLMCNLICFTDICLEITLSIILAYYATILGQMLKETFNQRFVLRLYYWFLFIGSRFKKQISRKFSSLLSVLQRNTGAFPWAGLEGLIEIFFHFLFVSQTISAL